MKKKIRVYNISVMMKKADSTSTRTRYRETIFNPDQCSINIKKECEKRELI